MDELLQVKDLKQTLKNNSIGILFCFGSSFISQLIKAKTRLNAYEEVPSHVALVFRDMLYESTSGECKVGNKTIPSGVRRWLLKDFIKSEKNKETKYYFYPCLIDIDVMEEYIHYPYGIDIILDYLLQDGSDGDSKGLICSQYANKCTKLINQEVVSPAELYRKVKELEQNAIL